jgi:hypothetical protein
MSRMSWRAGPGPERLVLLSAPGRDAVLATAAVLLTAGVFAVVIALVVGQIQRHAEGRQRPA